MRPWDSAQYVAQSALTTSYETCTVIDIDDELVPGLLRCTVDMAVTATAMQYETVGQWFFLKAWSDEDGNSAACPLSTPPDGRSVVEVFVVADSPLGEAILNEEMLEVSECCGTGFAGLDAVAASAGTVFGFAQGAATVSLLLALRTVADKAPDVNILLFDDGDEESLYAALAKTWASDLVDAGPQRRSVKLLQFDDINALSLEDCGLKMSTGAIAVIACRSDALVAKLTDLGIECCVDV
jgi:hypothetical protein